MTAPLAHLVIRAPIRGHLSAGLSESDITRIATSEWRREWKAKEVSKLIAAARQDGRAYNEKSLLKSVNSRKLTLAERQQRDKKVKAALREHEKMFKTLKRKRCEENTTKSVDSYPKRPRISAEKGLMSLNLKENVVVGGSSVEPARPKRSCRLAYL